MSTTQEHPMTDATIHDRFVAIPNEDRAILAEALRHALLTLSGEKRTAYTTLLGQVEPPVAVATYEDDEIKAELFLAGAAYRGVVTGDPEGAFVREIQPGLHGFDAMRRLLDAYAEEFAG